MTSDAGVGMFTLGGTVRDGTGVPVARGIAVEIVDLRLGGEHPVASGPVGPDGSFAVSFDPAAARSGPGASLDLAVRVVATPGDTVLARSTTRFDAGPHERFDVVVPPGRVPLAAEHTRLMADLGEALAVHAVASAAVADLEEGDDGRRDVTFLAAKTGWHPEAVAMAVQAENNAATTGLPAPLHYALQRAGLPAGDRLWALAPSRVLESVWERAAEEGVIEPDPAAIPDALATAAQLGDQAVLDLPTGVARGRFADLLPAGLDADQQAGFARLYREHRDEPAALWPAVRSEFGDEVAGRLEVTGALAAFTGNNAPLVARLEAGQPSTNPGDLVAAGFGRASRWRDELGDDVPVPDHVPGADDAERRDAYAAELAGTLRALHPTAALAADVSDGLMPVTGDAGTRDAVAGFLAEHHDAFDVTRHPVADFVARAGAQIEPAAQAEVAALQRVLAVAPTAEVAGGLRDLGLDSARDIAGLGEKAFVARAAGTLGEDAARETFHRSAQVHQAALAIATSHLVERAAPAVFAVPAGGPLGPAGEPGADALAAADAAEVVTFPTLETLFGSLDSGACPECESVLSPAAVLRRPARLPRRAAGRSRATQPARRAARRAGLISSTSR